MKRYLITFSYDGSGYKGYQRQLGKGTIEDELMRVLKVINNKKTLVFASGRTDAGVHALAQTAHFDLDVDIEPDNLKKALNSLLNADIRVVGVKEASNDFHARYNVKAKEYIYKINLGSYNVFERNYVYQYNSDLDIKRIKKASKCFVGKFDFKSFTSLGKSEKDKDCIREIYNIKVKKENDILLIAFRGSGFLRYMVRNIVGTLIEVGKGNINVDEIPRIIDKKDREAAGPTAPPEGLYLKEVFY